MLYFIGLGLGNEKDLSVNAVEVLKRCKAVYLESYTSFLGFNIKNLEKLIGKPLVIASREMLEERAEDTILKDAAKGRVALLVLGDIFAATTHYDLLLRARKLGIKIDVMHNASIFTAVSETGLSLYKFGGITSIPFENENIKAPIQIINKNQKAGYHTLVLLDLDPEKNRYMTINEALVYLLQGGMGDLKCIGVTALGSKNPEIKFGKADELRKYKFKKFPQSLIVIGETNFVEDEALRQWKLK